MSDVPVYMIVNLQITDTDTYRQYEKGFSPLLKKYGGEFMTYDDNPLTMEGFSPREGRMILWKFPSEAQAHAGYRDPEYQALSKHRRSGTQLEFLTMVRALAPKVPAA